MAASTAAAPAADTLLHTVGDLDMTVTRVTCDASYPTGGYTITAAQLGLQRVIWADTGSVNDGVASDVACWWEPNAGGTTGQLKAYTTAGEVANATNLSTQVCQVVAYGYAR